MTARLRRRFRIALFALCGLLLAQWALVTHACPVIRHAGEQIAQAQFDAEPAADLEIATTHDCHGAATVDAPSPPSDSPACLKHCADEGSASNGGGLAFAAAAAPPRVVRLALPAATGPLHWQQAPAHGDATAPPLSILYCISLR